MPQQEDGPPVFQCAYLPGTVPGAFYMFINSHSTILSIGSVWLPQVDVCGDLKVTGLNLFQG